MVTIEPGVYVPERFGIRIEDLVLVTAEGPEVMTHDPQGADRRLVENCCKSRSYLPPGPG